MTNPEHLPDLIISLSRDNVRLQLLGSETAGRDPWTASYPIEALFLEEQLSKAFDQAMTENPALIDHFDHVEVVLVDGQNLCVPEQYATEDSLSEISGRYLRNRHGDKLLSDQLTSHAVLAYNFPENILELIKEYYANAGQHHLTAIIWNSIAEQIKDSTSKGKRLFYVLDGKNLIVLGEDSGKLSFSKTYYVPQKEDLHYYIIACHRLMQPTENWSVTIDGQTNHLKLEEVSNVKFHHTLLLDELRTLIARHRI